MIPTMTIDWDPALRPVVLAAVLLPMLASLGLLAVALWHRAARPPKPRPVRARASLRRRHRAARLYAVARRVRASTERVVGRGNGGVDAPRTAP